MVSLKTVFATHSLVKNTMYSAGLKSVGLKAISLLADNINDEVSRSQIKNMKEIHDRIFSISVRILSMMNGLKRKKVIEDDVTLAFEIMKESMYQEKI